MAVFWWVFVLSKPSRVSQPCTTLLNVQMMLCKHRKSLLFSKKHWDKMTRMLSVREIILFTLIWTHQCQHKLTRGSWKIWLTIVCPIVFVVNISLLSASYYLLGLASLYSIILTAVSWTMECNGCTKDYEKRTRLWVCLAKKS